MPGKRFKAEEIVNRLRQADIELPCLCACPRPRLYLLYGLSPRPPCHPHRAVQHVV